MKYAFISLFIVLLSVVFFFAIKKDSVDVSEITSFKFFYTIGYALNSSVNYDINCTNNCVAKIKKSGVSEEDAVTVEIDRDVVKKLENILINNKVNKWNGFNKKNKKVLDGNSFSISIKMKNGNEISASGYMKRPKNYKKVREELDNFFNNLM